MNVNKSPVTYSSIVEIGEMVSKLEKETGDKYLKLHRGVMDVTSVELNTISQNIDFNQKKIQQYGGNDGESELIETIKDKFHLKNHYVMTTPGGMAGLDLVINSLSDETFYIPKYHWGSWNKVLTIHNKNVNIFNDFTIRTTRCVDPIYGFHGVVMLCYPSNPTGYLPSFEDLKTFIDVCRDKNQTVILDLPYYYLFNDINDRIHELYYDNVIIISSFSKSIGLSGFRVGYVATTNKELYDSMKIRSLYKYNSISTVPQNIINRLLTSQEGDRCLSDYRKTTSDNIKKNIQYLSDNNLLFDEYPSNPIGPFAIIKRPFEDLLDKKISSVPLNKFTIVRDIEEVERLKKISRISVSVEHEVFVKYFDLLIKNP